MWPLAGPEMVAGLTQQETRITDPLGALNRNEGH
jgi:hypothetical protein